MTEVVYDCTKCGACCAYWPNIPILPKEVNSIDIRLIQYTKKSPYDHTGLSMKLIDGTKRCIALEGEVGKDVKCSIYEIRPPTCRRFEAGSDLCKKVRREVLNILDE